MDPTGGLISTLEAAVPIDDEVGDDDSEVEESVPVELIPVPSGMKPPPMFAAVAAEVDMSAESTAPQPGRDQQDQAGASDAPRIEGRQVDAMAGSSPGDDEGTVDPSSKR